jgi:hypothetical protein
MNSPTDQFICFKRSEVLSQNVLRDGRHASVNQPKSIYSVFDQKEDEWLPLSPNQAQATCDGAVLIFNF